MEKEKATARAIWIAVVIVAVLAGGGAYYFQKNKAEKFQPAAQITDERAVVSSTDVEADSIEPLSYSTIGISVSVSKNTAPFDYTGDQLEGMAKECGAKHDAGYFDRLVAKFSGSTKLTYSFKYIGVSQESDIYIVTLLPNKAGYATLAQFKNDFNICVPGGSAYPLMLNGDWLVFVNSCGGGYGDGKGQTVGCEEIQRIIEPSLKLN